MTARNRAWRTAGALLAAVAALAAVPACSAGQITQTSAQVAPVPGANINCCDGINQGPIALRDLLVAYNGPQGYPAGSSAPLIVRIFNEGPATVTLVKVSAPDWARSVTLVGGTPLPPLPTAAPPPSPGASAATVTITMSPLPAQQGTETFNIAIPSTNYTLLVPGQGPYLQLTGLTRALMPGMSVGLQFTFADGKSTTLEVPVGLPAAPGPRPSAVAPLEEHE